MRLENSTDTYTFTYLYRCVPQPHLHWRMCLLHMYIQHSYDEQESYTAYCVCRHLVQSVSHVMTQSLHFPGFSFLARFHSNTAGNCFHHWSQDGWVAGALGPGTANAGCQSAQAKHANHIQTLFIMYIFPPHRHYCPFSHTHTHTDIYTQRFTKKEFPPAFMFKR